MRTDRPSPVPPVLVLGIGNSLLSDDGVGLELLELLRPSSENEDGADPRVEYVDGGTQGLMLLGLLEGRRSLLLLDAVQQGKTPGSVHLVREPDRSITPRGFGAHGGNASELLATARLLSGLPPRVHLVGVEPVEFRTRIGLSPAVEKALPVAAALARMVLSELVDALRPPEVLACTS